MLFSVYFQWYWHPLRRSMTHVVLATSFLRVHDDVIHVLYIKTSVAVVFYFQFFFQLTPNNNLVTRLTIRQLRGLNGLRVEICPMVCTWEVLHDHVKAAMLDGRISFSCKNILLFLPSNMAAIVRVWTCTSKHFPVSRISMTFYHHIIRYPNNPWSNKSSVVTVIWLNTYT
jgi:hypothetical protein